MVFRQAQWENLSFKFQLTTKLPGERTMYSRIAIGTLLVSWTSGALSVAADAPPDWSADQFLIGKWSCDLSQRGQALHEDAAYSIALDGRWLQLTYTVTSAEGKVPPKMTIAYETFDPSLSQWVYISLDSAGHHGESYSRGWKGTVKTYGPPAGSPQTWRLIATKLNDNEFTEVIETLAPNEQWIRTFSLHCLRAR